MNGSYCAFGANDYCFWVNQNDNQSSYWATEADETSKEWYLSVKPRNMKYSFGKSTSIRSALFPPLHPYHSDADSQYFNTCRVSDLKLIFSIFSKSMHLLPQILQLSDPIIIFIYRISHNIHIPYFPSYSITL